MSDSSAAKTTISQKMLRLARMGWTQTRDLLDEPKLSYLQYRICAAIYTEPDLWQEASAWIKVLLPNLFSN